MAIYEKKYNIKEVNEKLKDSTKKTVNIEQLLELIGFDLIDMNHFYVNHVRNRVRYKKDKR